MPCVVDGWNNEFEPAIYGLATEDADQVTLLSPINGASATWSQTFSWTAATDATYHLQIASDANFNNVVIEKTGLSTNSLTVDLGDLSSGNTYYWRVATQQPNRITKWSESATFKAPVRTAAQAVTLVSPDNGAAFEADFSFKFNPVTADGYKLQVSTSSDFANVAYETSTFSAEGSALKADYAISLLGKGTFYWRVVTVRKYYLDTPSEVRSFSVTKVPVGETEPGYAMKRDVDADSYLETEGLTLTNLWVRSVASAYSNITFENDGALNRGFAVVGNNIYVAGREGASSSSPTYLYVYSAETGERMNRLALSSNTSVDFYPCNDVMTDDAGNVLISNLTLNIGSTPLVLFRIDTTTGEATEVASLTYSGLSETRIDHCDVVGDVSTGNFSVFAAMRYSSNLIRWQFRNGALSSKQVVTLKSFAPSSASDPGIAPQVYAADENTVFVNGSSTYFTRYDFSTGKITGTFSDNTAIAPSGLNANGGTTFTFSGANYMFYPAADYSSSFKFNLVRNPSDVSFAGYSKLWTFPKQGIGSVNSQTWSAQCASVPASATSQMLYIYVPGNGLAAYKLSKTTLRGDVNLDGKVDVSDVTALVNIILNNDASNLEIADLNGDSKIDVSDVTALINIILN
ncbi:MAG: dockerin type I domain-containing protein [Sodaliphilus sp.]